MIKKPHLDHTQALSSYVSGSLGTLKKCFYGLEIFSNPLIDVTTKTSISQGEKDAVICELSNYKRKPERFERKIL